MYGDLYYRVDLTPQFLMCIKRYTPTDCYQSVRFTLIDILEFIYDAVMRGGFLPETKVVLENGEPVLPENLWEPFIDKLYDMVRRSMEDGLELENTLTDDFSKRYVLTNVRLTFDSVTDLPTSVTVLILDSRACIK